MTIEKEREGYILLGIKNMKQNLKNLFNNPQKMAPSLYSNLEKIEYKGKSSKVTEVTEIGITAVGVRRLIRHGN